MNAPVCCDKQECLLKTASLIYGIIFVLVGILGFIPQVTQNDMLFGIFHIDTAHSVVHLVTGLIFLATSACPRSSQIFFRIFGVLYAIVAIVGFWSVDNDVFGFLSNNLAVSWLHIAVAIIALIIGFGTHKARCIHKI